MISSAPKFANPVRSSVKESNCNILSKVSRSVVTAKLNPFIIPSTNDVLS